MSVTSEENMAIEDADALYDAIQARFAGLPVDELRAVGRKLGLLDDALAGTRRTVGKHVRTKIDLDIDAMENEESREEELAYLRDLQASLPNDTGTLDVAVNGMASIGEGGGSVEDRVSVEIETMRRKIEMLENGSSLGDRVERGDRVEHVLKPAFKVKGMIGKVGQGLSFVALERQVEAAKNEHSEQKIIEAVIQAINASIPLRGFLDTKRDLTLNTLMHVLASHFQEGDTTEMFNRLSNIVQNAGEDPVTFLLRAMELKEKILHASLASEIKYSQEQVQRQFLKVVESGLTSEPIRVKFRSALTMGVADEKLLDALTTICIQERDHDNKLKRNVKVARAHAVEVQDANESESEVSALKKMVEKLSVEVRELSAETGKAKAWQRSSSIRGCEACRKDGVGWQCRHCYKCGDVSHISRNCPLN